MSSPEDKEILDRLSVLEDEVKKLDQAMTQLDNDVDYSLNFSFESRIEVIEEELNRLSGKLAKCDRATEKLKKAESLILSLNERVNKTESALTEAEKSIDELFDYTIELNQSIREIKARLDIADYDEER